MKTNVNPRTGQQILDDLAPGFTSRITPAWIKNKKDKVDENNILHYILYFIKRVLKITHFYVDLIKDISLLASLIFLAVGLSALTAYPTMYSSQIIFLLLESTVFPLLISGISLAWRSPTLALGYEVNKDQDQIPKKKAIFLKTLSTLCSGLMPAFLINYKEREIEDFQRTLKNETLDDESMDALQEKK